MDNFIYHLVFGLILSLAVVHATTWYYQRKMRKLYSQAEALVAEIGAMEFLISQSEHRLAETHAISLRMENVLQAIVKTSVCDEGQCAHMEHILGDFKAIKERNEGILSRLPGKPKQKHV